MLKSRSNQRRLKRRKKSNPQSKAPKALKSSNKLNNRRKLGQQSRVLKSTKNNRQ